MPENTKIYKHDLEVYGGKAAVLAMLPASVYRVIHWRSLAFTIVYITILISFTVSTARHLPSRSVSDAGSENNRGGTD